MTHNQERQAEMSHNGSGCCGSNVFADVFYLWFNWDGYISERVIYWYLTEGQGLAAATPFHDRRQRVFSSYQTAPSVWELLTSGLYEQRGKPTQYFSHLTPLQWLLAPGTLLRPSQHSQWQLPLSSTSSTRYLPLVRRLIFAEWESCPKGNLNQLKVTTPLILRKHSWRTGVEWSRSVSNSCSTYFWKVSLLFY